MNKSKVLMGLLLIIGILTFSCGDDKGDDKGTINVDIDGIVSVTKNLSAGVASRSSMPLSKPSPGISSFGLATGQIVSFTPSSMKTTLTGMYLCPQIIISNGQRTCDETQTIIELSGEKEIELIGQEALSDLAIFSTEQVEAGAAGQYSGALLDYTGILQIRGTVEIGGTSYTIDHEVGMGTGGIDLDIPTPIMVDEGTSATFKAIFDVEDVAYLYSVPEGHEAAPGSSVVDEDTNTYLCVENLPLLPFVGTSDPTLEEYDVPLPDTFGDPDLYKLKITVFLDSEGNVYAAAWYVIFAEGYKILWSGFEPCMLDVPSIVINADNTYTFKTTADTSFCPFERELIFNSFELNDHSGTFIYAMTSYNYTATKR